MITTTEKLFHQLHHCLNLLHRGHANHEGHGRCGSHHGQGRIISILRKQDGISQKELAEMIHIRPSSLSEVLDKLENSALIERREHADDKRVSNVFLTDKGNAKALEVETARKNSADEMLSGLSTEEQEKLSTLLDKLLSSLEAKVAVVVEHRSGIGEHCPHGHHGHHERHERHGHHRHHSHHEHGQQAEGDESSECCRKNAETDRLGGLGHGRGCCGKHHGHERGHRHHEGCKHEDRPVHEAVDLKRSE